jgi:hypothetical protein
VCYYGISKKTFTYRDRFTLYPVCAPTQAWSPWQEGDKSILEKVQEKYLKMVDGIKAQSNEV